MKNSNSESQPQSTDLEDRVEALEKSVQGLTSNTGTTGTTTDTSALESRVSALESGISSIVNRVSTLESAAGKQTGGAAGKDDVARAALRKLYKGLGEIYTGASDDAKTLEDAPAATGTDTTGTTGGQ